MADETTTTSDAGANVVEIILPDGPCEETKMPGLEESFRDRLLADRDRHSTNATSFEKILEMQYAGSKEFRDAAAARIVLEAGSGRTRAETNGPGNTAAAGHAGGT